ncbi:MAG TPA: AAA family ATPase, partial [Candidatus Nanopelagicales bacterium]|nr:AAA family ATPase [Candidatus Nanopelagicales bacterium]
MNGRQGKLRFALGVSDFRKLREAGSVYVDKSLLIEDLLDAGAEALLIPRPRRMGKTLNLSMLRHFFEKSGVDNAPLFADLAIARSERAQQHFQRYPVVFMTFKDVKSASWEQCLESLVGVLGGAYRDHEYLLESSSLKPHEAETFTAIVTRKATEVQYRSALIDLCRHLHAHHGERVVLLIDEYDTPIHAGYTGGYYDQAVTFFRNLLSGALKDNPHLFKGVLTGILRVAKESVFSGLNNLAVYSILRSELSEHFGFTEDDVTSLVGAVGEPALLHDLRAWYDGYRFGGRAIYNPWSVLSFLDSADRQFRPYWVATASTEIVRDLLI